VLGIGDLDGDGMIRGARRRRLNPENWASWGMLVIGFECSSTSSPSLMGDCRKEEVR